MWSALSILLLLPLLIAATPLPAPETGALQANGTRVFPVNIIMTAGAAVLGVFVPHDGQWYSLQALTCLNAGANSYGACSTPSFDQVGVVAGNGPCNIIGTNGYEATLSGDPGAGLRMVAPPQQLTWVRCGP